MFAVFSTLFVVINNFRIGSSLPSSGCSSSGTNHGGSTLQFSFPHDGVNRNYFVHFPTNYNPNNVNGHSMVMAFPGYTTSASYFKDNFKMNSQSDEHDYIAVYLEGSAVDGTISWNDVSCTGSPGSRGATCLPEVAFSASISGCSNPDGCDWCNCNVNDVDYIDQLAAHLESEYCVDVQRQYALGYSNGGMMAHRVACDLDNRFAAVATFHGRAHIGFSCTPKANPLPIINVCGTTDNTIPCYEELSSQDKWYYMTVDDVTEDFAEYNGCDTNINPFNNVIQTISDGQRGWKCMGYDQNCNDNAKALFCEWNGGHGYPVKGQNNFGLSAVYDFFKDYQRGGTSPVPSPTDPPINTPSPTGSTSCTPKNGQCSNNNECCSGNCKPNGRCQ